MRAIRLAAAAIVLAALSTFGASSAQADDLDTAASGDGWTWVTTSGWTW